MKHTYLKHAYSRSRSDINIEGGEHDGFKWGGNKAFSTGQSPRGPESDDWGREITCICCPPVVYYATFFDPDSTPVSSHVGCPPTDYNQGDLSY